MKQAIASILILLSLANISTVRPFAPSVIQIDIKNYSPEIKYVDILVPKNHPKIHMGSPNPAVYQKYPGLGNSILAGVDSDGYVSYSLYYQEANFTSPWESGNQYEYYASFAGAQTRELSSMKIVTLDKSGHVLKITEKISVAANIFEQIDTPGVFYDYANNTVETRFIHDDIGYVAFKILFIGILVFLLSLLIQVLLALVFRTKMVGKVTVVNLCVQGLMAFVIPFISLWIPFAITVPVAALLFSVAEYRIYVRKSCNPAKKKITVFIVVANLITALVAVYPFINIY